MTRETKKQGIRTDTMLVHALHWLDTRSIYTASHSFGQIYVIPTYFLKTCILEGYITRFYLREP